MLTFTTPDHPTAANPLSCLDRKWIQFTSDWFSESQVTAAHASTMLARDVDVITLLSVPLRKPPETCFQITVREHLGNLWG